MVLGIDTNNTVIQTKYEKLTATNCSNNNSISIFNFDNIKEHKEELAIAGSLAAAAGIGLSIIGKKNLAYLLNKKIKFKNLEEAKEFGKSKITKALKKKKPYEELVIIDKDTNTIVAHAKGEKDYVKTDAFNIIRPSGHFSVEHGHPTGCIIDGKPATTPVSFDDYKSAIWYNGAEDIIAYDINGNFSKLRRGPNFRRLKSSEIRYYDQLQMQICDDVYLKKMLNHLPKEFHSVSNGKELGNIYYTLKQNGRLTKELDSKFQKAFKELEYTCPEYLYKIDEFWKMYAKDLGVIYETNYEYLKNKTTNNHFNRHVNNEFSDFFSSLNLDMLLKICINLENENKNILKEAFLKKDFETIKKICSKSIQSTSTARKITRNDFIQYMLNKFSCVEKIDIATLKDAEIRNLARLFGTTEDQIRHMDKAEYRRLCVQTHPDKNPDDCMASQAFIILNKIFQG